MMASDAVPAAVPDPAPDPAANLTAGPQTTPPAGLIASMFAPVEPARSAFTIPSQTAHPSTPGAGPGDAAKALEDMPAGSSATYHNGPDAPSTETSADAARTGTGGQSKSVWKAWLLAGATRWAKGGGANIKRLDVQKTLAARAPKEDRKVTVNRSENHATTPASGSTGARGGGAGTAPHKGSDKSAGATKQLGAKNSTHGPGGTKDTSARTQKGAGRPPAVPNRTAPPNNAPTSPKAPKSPKRTPAPASTPAPAPPKAGKTPAGTVPEQRKTNPAKPGTPGPAGAPGTAGAKGKDAASYPDASKKPGKDGRTPESKAGSGTGDRPAPSSGTGPTPKSAPGTPGKAMDKPAGKGAEKTHPTKPDLPKAAPGSKPSTTDPATPKPAGGKPDATDAGKPQASGTDEPTTPAPAKTDTQAPVTDPLRKSRETGYRDGARTGRATAHIKAYRDGFHDGWTDTQASADRTKAQLDQAHQNRKTPRKDTPVPPASSAAYHPRPEVESVHVLGIDATLLKLGPDANRPTITRGEVRSLKQYERGLEARRATLQNTAEVAKQLQAHADQQASRALTLLERAKGVKGGDKLSGALNRLHENAKTQAAEAAEMNKRAARAVDACSALLANVSTRYADMYQAVVNSPETVPAELAYYQGN